MGLAELFFRRKVEKVKGKIVGWKVSEKGNYPIFSFTTKDGRKICRQMSEKDILPLEAMPIEEERKKYMLEHLPVSNVSIEYSIDDPNCFTGNY